MKCKNCGKEVNSGNSCPFCGGELEKEKTKFSVVTIISLVVLILVITCNLGALIYTIYSAIDTGNDAFAWVLFFVFLVAFLTIPYYIGVFIVSIVCDRKVKNNILIKNIAIILLLLLPVFWVSKKGIEYSSELNKLCYESQDMSVTFPEDMSRSFTNIDYEGNYNMVVFLKDDCYIEYSVQPYKNDLSLIENFKSNSDNHTRVNNSTNTIKEDFDLYYVLKSKVINGKTWSLYEKDYTGLHYELYGIKINNNFYTIEVKDTGTNISARTDLVERFLSKVEYK